MPDTTISALTAASALDGTEQIPVVQGGANRKATGAQIRTLVGYIKHNMAATADPVATDDSNSGYSTGSMWLRSDTGSMWRCRSAGVGAAKWTKIDVADHPGYVSGNWYLGSLGATGTGTSINTMRLTPLVIKERITISDLGARLTTASSGGLFGLAIYAAHATTKRPTGLPLASVSGLSTGTATTVTSALGASLTIDPGFYWAAVLVDNTTALFVAMAAAGGSPASLAGSSVAGDLLGASTSGYSALSATGTTYAGGFVDLSAAAFTAVGNLGNAAVLFKVGSVP